MTVVLVCIGVYFVFTTILTVIQSHLIYYPNLPSREVKMTPDAIGLSYEKVILETVDRVKLSGWFIPAENCRGVVLFCHGNAGNISHRLESIQIFNRLEFSTLIFDYRGYGESGGRISERGTYIDAEAAWNYLIRQREVTQDDIVIVGRSLGGSIAAWLAQGRMPKGLIIESTFTSIRDIGSELYPYIPVKLVSRFSYNTLDYLEDVNCPVLIVHSMDDELIPVEHGRKLFNAAKEPKEFLEIKGTHNDGIMESRKNYVEGLSSFMSK